MRECHLRPTSIRVRRGKVADGANAAQSVRPCGDRCLRSPFRCARPGCAWAHGVWCDPPKRQPSTGNNGKPKLVRKREALHPAVATRGDPRGPAFRQYGWLDLDEVPVVGGPRSAKTPQNWRPATRWPVPPASRTGQLGRGSGFSRILLGIRCHVSASRLLAGHRTRREGAVDVRDARPQGAWLIQASHWGDLAWASVGECRLQASGGRTALCSARETEHPYVLRLREVEAWIAGHVELTGPLELVHKRPWGQSGRCRWGAV